MAHHRRVILHGVQFCYHISLPVWEAIFKGECWWILFLFMMLRLQVGLILLSLWRPESVCEDFQSCGKLDPSQRRCELHYHILLMRKNSKLCFHYKVSQYWSNIVCTIRTLLINKRFWKKPLTKEAFGTNWVVMRDKHLSPTSCSDFINTNFYQYLWLWWLTHCFIILWWIIRK